jgi:hypothetical protein
VSASGARRSLADLTEQDAPVPVRRAAALLAAVARDAEGAVAGHGEGPGTGFDASQVLLVADGSVRITGAATGGRHGARAAPSAGASVGRLLFELLVGRAPLGRDDAVEPHLIESLPPHVVALVARSCSDTPTQWPALADWEPVLGELAGGQLMDEPRRRRARRRRRRATIAVAVAVLAAISLAVVLLAPRWWATVTTEEGLCVGRTHLLS